MTARLHDEARRILFAEAEDLDAARAAAAKLTDAARRLFYVELEGHLAQTPSSTLVAEHDAASISPPAESLTPANEEPSAELPYIEAKRAAEAAFEVAYLSRLMEIANGKVTDAARLADVDRTNFRRLLQRNGLRPRKAPGSVKPTNVEPAAKYTDRITKILDENPQGLRTCEIAEKIAQAINFAFGILKSLERQGRVERHGSRNNTLWTLPGVQPVPRVETIPAATVAVLAKTAEPMDARRLRDEVSALLRNVSKPPSKAALKRGISRLISTGVLAYCGANEHGAMYVLARRGDDMTDLN
jgi:hypothetical protein